MDIFTKKEPKGRSADGRGGWKSGVWGMFAAGTGGFAGGSVAIRGYCV
ncbi:hypothetical protein [Thalassovita litoralis]|nr:hypothetical protein [Thalassovita litoralis]